MTSLRLLGNRVLVKPIREPESTTIVLVEYAKPADRVGEVVQTATTAFAEGDIVIFPPEAGEELVLDGEDYVVLYEQDVIGVIEENN